jgi:hypothetical protein
VVPRGIRGIREAGNDGVAVVNSSDDEKGCEAGRMQSTDPRANIPIYDLFQRHLLSDFS